MHKGYLVIGGSGQMSPTYRARVSICSLVISSRAEVPEIIPMAMPVL